MEKIEKVEWYRVDMQWLREITKRVYGRGYDIQMGERSNGEYDIVSTDADEWDYPGEYEGEDGWVYLETVSEAIALWLAQPLPKNDWDRPEWQPEAWAVFSDLADKGEIPHGTYFVDISW